ncbi:hypothetical protein [Streptomyces sp. NPDC052015]|uniref:hypothetical protein n=1 Tax=Streptomyces sp. NPDC052015 TaxID=3154755 RepID=UPI003429013F
MTTLQPEIAALVNRQRLAAGIAAEARHLLDPADAAFADLAPATRNQRRCRLLAEMRRDVREWRTGDVVRLYRANGWGCCRSTARHDLAFLARDGYLTEHGTKDDRRYTVTTTGGRP